MSEPNEQRTRAGDTAIADTITSMVIALILETPGVARLTGRQRKSLESEGERLKSAKQSKSVRVVIKNDALSINMNIIVIFGKPIPEIARLIQDETKKQVNAKYPHLTLAAVNVWVDGVSYN